MQAHIAPQKGETLNHNASSFFVNRHLEVGKADSIGILHKYGALTYDELANAINQAGNYLRRLGAQPEQRIVLHLHDGPEFVLFFMAALRIGAVAVPISTFCKAEQFAFYLNDTRASILITHRAYEQKRGQSTSPFLTHTVYVDDARWAQESPILKLFPVCGDDTAFWLYTSGSAGIQKGAIHSHAAMIACAQNYGRDVLDIRESDRCFSASKLFFAYGLGNSVIFPFAVGASCILNPDRNDPETIAAVIKQYRPTLFFAVPTLYEQLLGLPHVDRELFRSVRMCISAGEYLPESIFNNWRRRTGQTIYDGIGSTEALHIFCSNRPNANKPGTSGIPVSGYELKIVDPEGAPVRKNEVGRLLVRGKTLAKGYWNRYDLSQLTFQGEWLATGDIYQQTDEGYFRYLGRQDDVFKSSGLWVSPGEIEQVLLSHPYVKEAAVVAVKNSSELNVAKAFVVLKEIAAIDSEECMTQEIYNHLHASLPRYKIPAAIKILPALPKTSTGKISRAELRKEQGDEYPVVVSIANEALRENGSVNERR